MKKKLDKHRVKISYFLKNAPLAILTSSLPGFVNYAAILFISATYSMADVGQYRLIMSYFALMGLFSLQESSKVLIRIKVEGDEGNIASLFFSRLYSTLLVTLIIFAIYYTHIPVASAYIPEVLLYIALLSCINYPADIYLSYLQADKRFPLLAGLSLLKYLFSLIIFVSLMLLGHSIMMAALCQVIALTLFNLIFLIIWVGPLLTKHALTSCNPIKLIKNKNSNEAFTLSLANWLPGTLEHFDKMIIGFFFGLEALGLYTLAFSTGRFIYNALKPAFYIYYRNFVDSLPQKKLLMWVMVIFTLFGAALSLIFLLATQNISFFTKFEGAETVVYILFLSYGIAMVDAIYTQSYGINKQAKSKHLLYANTSISLFCLSMFMLCAILPVYSAMIVCALHYPIRHGGTILMLSYLKKHS